MMIAVGLLVVLAIALFAFTRFNVWRLQRRYPPLGTFTDVGGYRLHCVDLPPAEGHDLPPLLFIHGASGNLRDQMRAFRKHLEGRARLVFVDRPGHGYSERGPSANDRPDGQAAAIAALLARKGIDRAIVVAHSLGCAIAASFAVQFPERTAGLVMLAPATHPWPGGVAWYNRLTARTPFGALFAHLVAMPAGLAVIDEGMKGVFAPNPMPPGFRETAPALVLRPRAFRANAADLSNLHAFVVAEAGRYRSIKAPTVIVTGDDDRVVLPDLHARGLYRDIEGSQLIWLKNVGHKPDYVAADLAVAAIEKVAGHDRDPQALVPVVERRVAEDASDADQMPLSPSEPI